MKASKYYGSMVCGLTRWLPHLSSGHMWLWNSPNATWYHVEYVHIDFSPWPGSLPARLIWAEHKMQSEWKGSPANPPSSGRKRHPLALNQSPFLTGLPCWKTETTTMPGRLLQRKGPSHCQTLGSFHRAACLANAGPGGWEPLPSDLFVWGCASSTLGFSPTWPQKVKMSLLL